MKTPIDATGHAGATLALLNSGVDFAMVDLWIVTLNGGAVIRWHSAGYNAPITFAAVSPYGGTYKAGPLIDRGKLTTKLGLEVATLDMKISATLGDLINGAPLIPFAQGRGFDGATVVLLRAFVPAWTVNPPAPIGAVIGFSGRVTQLKDVGRSQFTMTVSAWTVLFNVNMGPDVFQAGCINTHYDADCTLTPSFVTGTVASGATKTALTSNLTQANGFFTKAALTFLTGANAGLNRAVQSYLNASGAITFAFPLPTAPSAGDTFQVARGCLLTVADCDAQSNRLHFRAAPFTPPAITGNGV